MDRMRDATLTRERIDRAAIELFVERGIDGASIREIAKKAKISLGALYNHYPSKEDLALSLFSESWAIVGNGLLERSRASDRIEQQIQDMVTYVFDLFERDWELASINFLQRHGTLRKLRISRSNPYVVFRLTIVGAMNRGEIPSQDPDVATAMVMGAIVQVIDTKILGRIRESLPTLSHPVAQACVALLRAGGEESARHRQS